MRPWHNHKPSQRSRPHSGALLVLAVIAGACQLAITEPVDPWQLQKTSSTASLRGLSPVDCLCAYVSGSRGTVLRTVDGGGTWESIGPVGKQALDFRSVYATLLDRWLNIPSEPVLGGAFRPVEFV